MVKRAPYIFTLIELYSRGASVKGVEISSAGLGEALGLSQQAVSKHLLEMEKEGLVRRSRSGRSTSVTVTRKGSDEVLDIYTSLGKAMEGRRGPVSFHGQVFTGMGEGGYYVSRPGYRRQFLELLGFEPYPGTLNLVLGPAELELRKQLRFLNGIEILGFKDGKRTFGPVKCFRAKVEGGLDAAALEIERTHHGDAVLEIVSPWNLRKELRLKDGGTVSVTVYPEE